MRLTRWPDRLAPLSLGLALWTALPSLQWCTTTWEQCWSRCEATVAAAESCEDAASCAAPTCESLATCAAAEPVHACAAAGSCDSGDPPPFGDRAWCVGMHADGVPTRSLEVAIPAAPSHPAVVIEAPRPAITLAGRMALPAAPCPGIASAHAPPLTRAPPARA